MPDPKLLLTDPKHERKAESANSPFGLSLPLVPALPKQLSKRLTAHLASPALALACPHGSSGTGTLVTITLRSAPSPIGKPNLPPVGYWAPHPGLNVKVDVPTQEKIVASLLKKARTELQPNTPGCTFLLRSADVLVAWHEGLPMVSGSALSNDSVHAASTNALKRLRSRLTRINRRSLARPHKARFLKGPDNNVDGGFLGAGGTFEFEQCC